MPLNLKWLNQKYQVVKCGPIKYSAKLITLLLK